MVFDHITVFSKNASDVRFAYAYHFEGNGIKVILKSQRNNLGMEKEWKSEKFSNQLSSLYYLYKIR